MKINIPQSLNGQDIMRRANYGLLHNGSFGRRMGSYDYPRFHVYLDRGVINLHLDQKKANYEGSSAHNGEFDGDLVEREIERISGIIESMLTSTRVADKPREDTEEKKGFWGSLFG